MRTLRALAFTWCVPLAMMTVLLAAKSAGAVQVQSICRLKGQEPYRLRAFGLVTGLNGTGDSRMTPVHQALLNALNRSGVVTRSISEVAATRNIALVTVSCEIPGVGAREGGRFDCFVSSVGTARNLSGGRLMQTALSFPMVPEEDERLGFTLHNPPAVAIAEGAVTIEDPNNPNSGRVENGARLLQELQSPFLICDDFFTLVIDNSHAGFVAANRIAGEINRTLEPQLVSEGEKMLEIAYPLDGRNIQVMIPQFARRNKVAFVADILEVQLFGPSTHSEARVIVNEKSGTIVVTGEVEITPVLISQNNLLIFPLLGAAGLTAAPDGPPYVPLASTDPPFAGQPQLANLNDLLVALNRAQVPNADKISIIRELDKSGKLHAKVIYE